MTRLGMYNNDTSKSYASPIFEIFYKRSCFRWGVQLSWYY